MPCGRSRAETARACHDACVSTPRSEQSPNTAIPSPELTDGGDPFPRERFVALIGHLPRYLRLAVGLAGDPRLPRTRRAALLAAAAYLASPIDLIPGIIPVVGQLDDLAVALFALRTALRALDPVTRGQQLAAAGLAPEDLDTDLDGLGQMAGWLARRGIAIGVHLATLAASASLVAVGAGARAVRRGTPVVLRAGGRLARAAGGSLAAAGQGGARAIGRRLRRERTIGPA
ncbi:MAG: hypothetical protein H6Q36_1791 [Chloroflexi bacterium]|nr:hypothetical protein [Chloroflexota bacterium]